MQEGLLSLVSKFSLKVLIPLCLLIIVVIITKLIIDSLKVLKKVNILLSESETTITKVDKLLATIDNTTMVLDNVFKSKVNFTNQKISAVGKVLKIPVLENVENNMLGSIISTFKN